MTSNVKLKKISSAHVDSEGSWAVSYGDMITLLLSFFVIFFSFDFTEKDETTIEKNLKLNIMTMDKVGLDATSGTNDESVMFDDINNISILVEKVEKNKIVVFFRGANFFETGQLAVNDIGKNILDEFSAKFIPFAGMYKLRIHAFTDDRPVRSKAHRFKDNIELSALRSISVMRYLKKIGVPIDRVEITGKGILSKNALKVLNIESADQKEIRKMSRTIAFILYREDIS